jgi:geranylgeranyl diphosphate synthase, type I
MRALVLVSTQVQTTSPGIGFIDPYVRAASDGLASARIPGSGLLRDMAEHQLANPGKLLRPALCLWACERLGGDAADALPAAVALQLVHEFTLVHDDVQDGDLERRHRPTVWALWGQAQAINCGDGMFAWAFEQLLASGAPAPAAGGAALVLARAVRSVVDGQCRDLACEGHPETAPDEYVDMVRLKTGSLVGAALEIGAIAAAASSAEREALRAAGVDAGAAFQVRDDWLGTWGDPAATGKPADGDLRRRKLTFPVCWSFHHSDADARNRLRLLFRGTGDAPAGEARRLLRDVGAEAATVDRARSLAAAAEEAARQGDLDAAMRSELTSLFHYFVERAA